MKAKPSWVISTLRLLASTNPPICNKVLTPWLSLTPSLAKSMPVLPTMYPRTPSHCLRANSSSSATDTASLLETLHGAPKDLWSPPPVRANRSDSLKGVVRLYERGCPAFATAVRTCSRSNRFRAWSRSLRKNQISLLLIFNPHGLWNQVPRTHTVYCLFGPKLPVPRPAKAG